MEAFLKWLIDRIESTPDKDFGRVFGQDSFDPDRQLRTVRSQLRMLIEGDTQALEASVNRSVGEEEAHDLVVRLEKQMRDYDQSLDEITSIFRNVASSVHHIDRVAIKDALETLRRQLDRPRTIRPTRKDQVRMMCTILAEVLKDYPLKEATG